ncbi:PREDICTED: succinyl-CoA ligase [GDP-forming] subunit beta, mitochondrial-like isoform X2 [Priapulus caudatus]|nr:PREDICTED: succinyl-CoA ligase [GDP-forming] subunit beta, mitochondrial-like isoform X2 [Priapulus caudatus]XP_014674138.1 PREDICTED: succinyl-CoA ligase [GDP-forming] subunit beta, mitochondrial-like isoform X2 [Priapulus caudatus]XP_014674139.1 PREDICTED: succinyl-CoA ligase [GDP-forming] subunit beta, mitochondrial-like isoform X2 [Priapulus caudatus]
MIDHNVNVQHFRLAETGQDADRISKTLKVKEFVIKAQILAGGRGKGVFSNGMKGGVKLTKDPEDVKPIVKRMLGEYLKTKQTTGNGVLVSKVMVAEALDIAKETYFAILLDRESGGPMLVGSPEGGVDIETVAEEKPHLIYKEPIDVFTGITTKQANDMATKLGFTEEKIHMQAAHQIINLYNMFMHVDATQIEINPFGETTDGRVVCFDAKIAFDDNAEFRQQSIFEQGDTAEADPREVEAAKSSLNYIGLDGNIGCLVNGAGLAMATMDIIKLYGGEPANFLDCGGSVQEDQVYDAFKLLTSDTSVKAILVNIFGGIVDCTVIAHGIANTCKYLDLKIPMVVRLEGNNVDKAREILKGKGLNIIPADNFAEAAQKVVASLK